MQNLFKIFLAMAVNPAFALMPIAKLSSPGCDRNKVSQVEDFRELLEQVNLGKVDNRGAMSTFFREIAPHEQRAMSRIQGTVTCTIDGWQREANATLVEDGGQIMTNVHVFEDKNNRISLERMPSCSFSSKSNPGRSINLVLREGMFKFGTLDPENVRANDYAFVRLDSTVTDIDAPKFGAPPEEGEEIFLVTAKAYRAKTPIDSSQLVVRRCTGRDSYSSDSKFNSTFLSDCGATRGDSGGIYYARRNGRWEAVGLHQSGGYDSADGLDYDVTTNDKGKRSFSMGLGFDERMLKESQDLARRANDLANARGDRKVNSLAKDRT